MKNGLFLPLLLAALCLHGQFWYLDIRTGQLHEYPEGGERFRDAGLLAVARGTAQDVAEQLPHALDAYGIDYDYTDAGLIVYNKEVYQTWRLLQAGEDIRATLGMLLLADLFVSVQGTQARVVGHLFRRGFSPASPGTISQLWELPAVQRGIEFEVLRAGAHRLPNGFPVVDILRNGTAISVKSVDITLPSYHSVRLLTRLRRFVDRLADFRGASWGGYRVPGNAQKALEVVVPQGKATPEQLRMFEEVVAYGQRRNITVRFIEL